MESLIVFGILSIPVVIISWKTLFKPQSHGFYRFFSWECIIWLLVSNYKSWFDDPFGVGQIFSWILLLLSAYLVIAAIIMLKRKGKPLKSRTEEALYSFEKTSELIETGIFKYIRHPMYASLIGLSWGIFLKNPTFVLSIVAFSSTIFLYLTALSDEKECLDFFGDRYRDYMKRTKRFVPFVF